MSTCKDIEGFNYKISRYSKVINKLSNKKIKPHLDKYGYLRINLYNNGINKKVYIHRLVALTFIPNPDNKPQVNHIDGNKQNNNISNLEWCTISENAKHAFKIGLRKPNNIIPPSAKLNYKIANDIRLSYSNGVKVKTLSEKHNVSIHTIYKLLSNNSWKNN